MIQVIKLGHVLIQSILKNPKFGHLSTVDGKT